LTFSAYGSGPKRPGPILFQACASRRFIVKSISRGQRGEGAGAVAPNVTRPSSDVCFPGVKRTLSEHGTLSMTQFLFDMNQTQSFRLQLSSMAHMVGDRLRSTNQLIQMEISTDKVSVG
jgi:hypothetical protein